jgi:hypothetical protein
MCFASGCGWSANKELLRKREHSAKFFNMGKLLKIEMLTFLNLVFAD